MDERTAYCIDAELQFARAKFPGKNMNFAALIEEVGELAKALMDNGLDKATGAEVYAEAIQVAVMAIRVAEEGSKEFPYRFQHSHYQKFNVNKLKALTEEKVEEFPSETVLADNYPVFADFLYVVDGQPARSDISGTVADLKRYMKAKEVRRCDINARALCAQDAERLAEDPKL